MRPPIRSFAAPSSSPAGSPLMSSPRLIWFWHHLTGEFMIRATLPDYVFMFSICFDFRLRGVQPLRTLGLECPRMILYPAVNTGLDPRALHRHLTATVVSPSLKTFYGAPPAASV